MIRGVTNCASFPAPLNIGLELLIMPKAETIDLLLSCASELMFVSDTYRKGGSYLGPDE
jgi:hypothetical protein